MIQVRIAAYVAPEEKPALAAGLALLQTGLEGEKAMVSLTPVLDMEALLAAPSGTVRLVSLQTALDALEMPWPDVEHGLRGHFAALAETGDPVLVSTVFRVVNRVSDDAHARLIRIRRLNLLATELSREFGAFVIDIDRVLADIGGGVLKTDYRLTSEAAAELAGHTLAIGLSTNALDGFLPFEAQERVTALINASQSVQRPAVELIPADLMSMGKGRRRQRVAAITDTSQENHAGWLVKQALTGQIGLSEAAQRLIMVIRRRGVKESFSLLTSGIFRMMNKKAAT